MVGDLIPFLGAILLAVLVSLVVDLAKKKRNRPEARKGTRADWRADVADRLAKQNTDDPFVVISHVCVDAFVIGKAGKPDWGVFYFRLVGDVADKIPQPFQQLAIKTANTCFSIGKRCREGGITEKQGKERLCKMLEVLGGTIFGGPQLTDKELHARMRELDQLL